MCVSGRFVQSAVCPCMQKTPNCLKICQYWDEKCHLFSCKSTQIAWEMDGRCDHSWSNKDQISGRKTTQMPIKEICWRKEPKTDWIWKEIVFLESDWLSWETACCSDLALVPKRLVKTCEDHDNDRGKCFSSQSNLTYWQLTSNEQFHCFLVSSRITT